MWIGTPAIGVVAFLLVVAATIWVLRILAKRTTQLQRLMQRIEDLEQHLVAAQPNGSEIPRPGAEPEVAIGPELSQDALAGWTSHVQRLLTEEAEPVDPAEAAVVAIYRRIEEPLRPSDLAEELAVSLRTLERGLQRSLECSPTDLIMTVKMREARRMLESGRFRVGEVASRLSFADTGHFSRRYRRFFRCPPSTHMPRGPAHGPPGP